MGIEQTKVSRQYLSERNEAVTKAEESLENNISVFNVIYVFYRRVRLK